MLGLKIVVTGALSLLLAGLAIKAIGKKMPSLWVAIPVLTMFFAGLAAVVGGFLWLVWA